MVSVGFKTDKGRSRVSNEDSLFVLPEEQLYIVADGVGGHNSGELASRMAVGYIAQYVAMHPLNLVGDRRALRRYFKSCIEGANELIYGKAQEDPANSGMATTTVLTYLQDDDAFVVNVGDSRAYLLRDGVLRQVTEDHTRVHEMVQDGLITEKEAEDRPDRNMITRAVGGEARVRPDFFRFKTYPGDIIILCTDGLYGEVSEDRIAEIGGTVKTMHRLAKVLVEEANNNGGGDNITAVCIKIQ